MCPVLVLGHSQAVKQQHSVPRLQPLRFGNNVLNRQIPVVYPIQHCMPVVLLWIFLGTES
jgi:hypothetical protein